MGQGSPAVSAEERVMRPLVRPLLRLLCAVVALLVIAPVATAAMIEPYAPYQPQTNCSPDAKPGTVRLSDWLQRQYPGSGSLGISRSCRDGGVSEHKEGRAFDWAVNVGSARDRGYVADFLRRIFATDADGNRHALARRMGIMYLIWNDRIYSSYYGFSERPYRGCANLSGCSDTLRHRNHVHLSLSRDGGAGRTSWYTGSSSVPDPTPAPPPPTAPPTTPPSGGPGSGTPVLDLSSQRYAALSVPADGTAKVTPFRLRAGTTYQLTAAGLYGYGSPSEVADASCRWSGTARRWLPYPSRSVAAAHGSLNLRVDGSRFVAATCHPRSHVYTRTITPTSTRTVRLDVANVRPRADGALRVLVSRPGVDVTAGLPTYPALGSAPAVSPARAGAGLISETVDVSASDDDVRTVGSLEEGASYRLTVSGTASLGAGVSTDGRCLSVSGAWYPQASLDRRRPGARHGRLFVDGRRFDGTAAAGSMCGTRTHVLDRTATRTGRLQLALWDPLTRADNSGAVQVTVQRLTPMETPVAAAAETPATSAPWRQRTDTVSVSPRARTGTLSAMRLRAGQAVTLKATGTITSGSRRADASCVRLRGRWRTSDSTIALRQDPLDLWVDGRRVTWRATSGAGRCSRTHTYTTRFVAAKDGPLRLSVLDLWYRDNAGRLTVTMTRG